MLLFDIFLTIIAPIFVLIAIGYLIEKKNCFDMTVLTKTLLYLIMPATILTTLSASSLSPAYVRVTVMFCLAMIGALYLLSSLVSWVMRHNRGMKQAFSLSVMFYNSGNFGFPASDLAFPALGLAIQVIVLATQNIINFTLGVFLVSAGRFPVREAIKTTLAMPFIYALFVALLMRTYHFALPPFLALPLKYLSQALVPMALLALGIQLAKTRIQTGLRHSIASVVCRLLAAPVIGITLVWLFEIDSAIAPILVCSTSYPTAINTALIAMELRNEEEFAANAVFLSTILSALTVGLVLFGTRAIWG